MIEPPSSTVKAVRHMKRRDESLKSIRSWLEPGFWQADFDLFAAPLSLQELLHLVQERFVSSRKLWITLLGYKSKYHVAQQHAP